jgi:hypothetical protein
MLIAMTFVIGVAAQALSGLEPRRPLPFDYEPPRTIKKIRPNLPEDKRVVYYPVEEASK